MRRPRAWNVRTWTVPCGTPCGSRAASSRSRSSSAARRLKVTAHIDAGSAPVAMRQQIRATRVVVLPLQRVRHTAPDPVAPWRRPAGRARGAQGAPGRTRGGSRADSDARPLPGRYPESDRRLVTHPTSEFDHATAIAGPTQLMHERSHLTHGMGKYRRPEWQTSRTHARRGSRPWPSCRLRVSH